MPKNILIGLAASGALIAITAAGCASAPPPTARLVTSEAAIRSARELGAEQDPQAALHLKLADEQLQAAKGLIRDNENQRAALVLDRATSDAELAVMLTREKNAKAEADKAKANLTSKKVSQ